MLSIYISYGCVRCKKTTILLTEEVEDTLKSGKYLECAHCGCKKLIKGNSTDDLRDCMKHSRYKRNKHGAIEQVK